MSVTGPSEAKDQQRPSMHGYESNHTDMRQPDTGEESTIADWRRPLMEYLEVPSSATDWKISRQELKYMMLDGELYRCMMDGLLLKCLDIEQAQVAMGEVHEGTCGAHQSAQKMKWTIIRAGL
jgi:hypothetical protein